MVVPPWPFGFPRGSSLALSGGSSLAFPRGSSLALRGGPSLAFPRGSLLALPHGPILALPSGHSLSTIFPDVIQSTLDHSQILVLRGETGSDKSTQVPAFILEDQLARGLPCKIYCTEPRRISVIARRVSRELGDSVGAIGTSSLLVGCSIRLESNTTRNTRLAFVTNAIEYADWSTQENSPINLHNKSHKNRNRNRFDWDEDTVYGNDDEETLVDGGQQNSSQSMRLEKRYSYQTINTVNLLDERAIPYELILHLLERLCFEDKERHHFSVAVLIFMPGLGEIRRMNDLLTEHHAFGDENSFR
ncbi:hypothetical protein BDR03DRAFT_1018908 [Suillus americanus]|nr:hypothetical protein BDR03DRAFT_1018908 [Suillus americanus]